ncbi:MAG: hypothetical protein BGP01_03695 [Paludibacter sp. 47-17]|nr:hypothetical protein [Weeksellaceae bacterium]OJX87683.1 MAG: hypothetical protein BGP01_03695 [Paludibacter sp. 47-17]
MKNFDVNTYGVQEMNVEELRETYGGSVYKSIVKFLEFLGVVEIAEAFVEGFSAGAQQGYKDQQKK